MKKMLKVLTTWGVPVAYLNPPADALHNVRVELNQNGPWVLSGILPYNSEKWDYFTDAYIFEIDNRHFRLVSTEEQRDDKGRLLANFKAEGMWAIELGSLYGPTRLVEVLSATAPQAMTAVLAGTGWSVGTVTVPDTEIHDLETEKDSVIQNLQRIRELWGGDLVFDTANRTVSLYAEGDYGADNGMQFRYRKNNRQIKRSIKWLPINRLYVYGKDDLTIATVNGGLEYLEDFTYTRQALGLGPTDPIPQAAIREGKITNQDIDDPAELLDWGQKQLPDLLQPKAAYTVSVADLRTLTGHEHEIFDMGDWATAIDEGLGVDVKARIVRYVYDPFGGYYPGIPPMAEVTLANFEDNIQQLLADLARTAQTVKESILKNRILRQLALDNLINTAAVEILSGDTQLSWAGNGLTAQDVDEQGNPTGFLLRLTGRGLIISEDGGQTWDLAIKGSGILANTIIVDALYALSTADGYTKLKAEGLHVFDESEVLRLIAGWWMDGATKRFGLQVKAADGATTLLDDRGLLQTWEVPRCENLDPNNTLVMSVYLPPETISIHKALLRFRLQAFRSYSKSAASGGAGAVTSDNGGGVVSATNNGGGYYGTDSNYRYVSGDSGDSTRLDGSHQHGYWDDPLGANFTDFAGNHSHPLPLHGHYIDVPSHSHDINVPAHSHAVSFPNHSHPIEYGIYTSTVATGVVIKVNGIDRTQVLGGPFSIDQVNINIAPYLMIGAYNTIELGSTQLGRIDATIFIQARMGI